MTILRIAAQQALEAMLNFHDDISDEMFAAIAALKAALAQEQAEPDLSRCPQCNGPADNGHDRSIPPNPYLCTKCMAEPAQDPVAWRYKPMIGSPWSLSDDGYYISCKRDKGYIVEPLYTAPPQRQPLSGLEVERLLEQVIGSLPAARNLVRAVERAHGIIESEIKVDSHQTLDDAMQQPRAMAEAYENGYKAGAAAERERIIQFLQEMQRQVGDGHNYYGVAAMRIRERV